MDNGDAKQICDRIDKLHANVEAIHVLLVGEATMDQSKRGLIPVVNQLREELYHPEHGIAPRMARAEAQLAGHNMDKVRVVSYAAGVLGAVSAGWLAFKELFRK